MIFIFVYLLQAKTHVHVTKMLLGNWIVEHTFINSEKNESILNTFNVSFTNSDDTTLIAHSTRKDDPEYRLVFHEGGVFELYKDNSDDEIAEFEFFHQLFPHASASGSWDHDSIFIGELISDTSMSLSIFNKNSKTTNIFSFSKDIVRDPPSFFEANFTLIATLSFIGIKFIMREFRKRKAEIELKKQSDIDMKKYMEEEDKNEKDDSAVNEEEDVKNDS